MTHEELKAKALKNAGVKKEYKKLELEFKLYNKILTARKEVALNQEQIADIMSTKKHLLHN